MLLHCVGVPSGNSREINAISSPERGHILDDRLGRTSGLK